YPFAAVPLLHVGRMMAVVVRAAYGEGRGKVRQAELLEARFGDPERFQPAAHLVPGDILLACEPLRVADALGHDHRRQYAPIVEVFAHLVLRGLALALVDHVFHDVLGCREIGADRIEVERQIALSTQTRWAHVIFVARPPYSDEMIQRITGLGRFL